MPIRACIFDMDDLLVRSGPLWRVAETALLHHLGAQWSAELAQRYKGMNTLDVARTIHAALRPELDVVSCQQLMRSTLIDTFAAELLGARPEACVVFEDSLVGVMAARAAGMYCYAVPSGAHAEIGAIATRVFATLEQVGEFSEPAG